MTTELKPCPFCGGEAEIHPSSDWDVKFTGATYFAWCDKCETRGDYYDTEAEAVEAWNNRAERTCRWKPADFITEGEWWNKECGESFTWEPDGTPNYCPNCGAKVVD